MSTSTQAEVPRKQGGFLRQSSTSSMAALLAMLSGLLLDVVLASKFGAGRASDAFFVASRIPIGLSALLMTVATQVLVPMFVRDRREGGRHSVAIFASRVMTSVVLSARSLPLRVCSHQPCSEVLSSATPDLILPRRYPGPPAFRPAGIAAGPPQPGRFAFCCLVRCLRSKLSQPFKTHRAGVVPAV